MGNPPYSPILSLPSSSPPVTVLASPPVSTSPSSLAWGEDPVVAPGCGCCRLSTRRPPFDGFQRGVDQAGHDLAPGPGQGGAHQGQHPGSQGNGRRLGPDPDDLRLRPGR